MLTMPCSSQYLKAARTRSSVSLEHEGYFFYRVVGLAAVRGKIKPVKIHLNVGGICRRQISAEKNIVHGREAVF